MIKKFLQDVAILAMVIAISGGVIAEFDNSNTSVENSGITTCGRGDLDSPEEVH